MSTPRRGTDLLPPEHRELARSLRQAARIVGHAALPADYRLAAFLAITPLLVPRGSPLAPADLAGATRGPLPPVRSC